MVLLGFCGVHKFQRQGQRNTIRKKNARGLSHGGRPSLKAVCHLGRILHFCHPRGSEQVGTGCLCRPKLDLQDVSGRATWSKNCDKMSLAEQLGARNASRCVWQRQFMLQDVSGRATWSKKCFEMSLAEPLGARQEPAHQSRRGWLCRVAVWYVEL